MMTSAAFYLALMFCLGTCAVVKIMPEIREGEVDEVINDLKDVIDELKVEEKFRDNQNINSNTEFDLEDVIEELKVEEKSRENQNINSNNEFGQENTNTSVDFYKPIMRCAWYRYVGACCIKFHFSPTHLCVVIYPVYPHVIYIVKAGTRKLTSGNLNSKLDDRELDIVLSSIKVEFKLKLISYTTKQLIMCFKGDYHTRFTKFDGVIGCFRKIF